MLPSLTTRCADVKNVNMDAELTYRRKTLQPDGSIIEIVIWKVPAPIKGSTHFYKYRLFFGSHGERVIGIDNERGKGDHIHLANTEKPYHFQSVEKLIEDFYVEIERRSVK